MVWEIKLFVVISEILLYDLKEYEETGGKIDEETSFSSYGCGNGKPLRWTEPDQSDR